MNTLTNFTLGAGLMVCVGGLIVLALLGLAVWAVARGRRTGGGPGTNADYENQRNLGGDAVQPREGFGGVPTTGPASDGANLPADADLPDGVTIYPDDGDDDDD